MPDLASLRSPVRRQANSMCLTFVTDRIPNSRMEALYSKLYSKYTNIKTKKFSELDQLNVDQELKFVSYVSAAEDLINHLKNEHDRMSTEINDLRSEVASIRSAMDEKCVEYQRLLMEENQKNIALQEEVEKVRKLQQEGHFGNSGDAEDNHKQLTTPVGTNGVSKKLQNGSVRKRRRLSGSETETEKGNESPPNGAQHDASVRESSFNLCTTAGSSEHLVNDWLPECCRRNTDGSGDVSESGLANCLFQALTENLVGMKLSALAQSEGLSVSALHPSTGYSFSLTWTSKAVDREDTELLYRVQSLGTFERVAPEWMREVLIFSTTMLPIFFERVSRVIKLHP